MIGKILGNRYEIVEKVGTGGMSDVYKAKCRKLNRFVAIKILKKEFADNEDFIKSFKIEAQAAASLSHANIISIYDVGNHNDLNYIVMEFVEGITLKEYISKKKSLDWREAVNIALQICSALEVAHKNGIVHRDVKPHNIIITNDKVAKVADFGIAKAATYFTVAYTGNAIGSVHYFSPEQAKGGFTDNKSDIYSLGVVIYEMLTGTLPFDGDTPVSIAYKHIEQRPIPPIEINSDIPVSLNNIVLKAMAKNSDKRFQNATSMISDLKLVLEHPSENIVEYNEQSTKLDSPTIIIPAVNISEMKNNENNVEEKNHMANKKSNKSRVKLIAAMVTSFAIVLAITFIGYKLIFSGNNTASEVPVPNLIGKNEDEARLILSQLNLSLKIVDRESSDKIEAGKIYEQFPAIGIPVKIPNEVEVKVSTGPRIVKVPNIVRKDKREAKIEITNVGLVPILIDEPSDEIPIGFVISTNPKVGSEVEKGEEIEILVSTGPKEENAIMPNLIGSTESQARKTLEDNNLELKNVVYEESDSPYGTIIKQSIKANEEVPEGTGVNITLSTGKVVNRLKQIELSIPLPSDREKVEVEVIYINSKNNRIIAYPKTNHKTSNSPLNISISGEGKGRVQIYFDGIKASEDKIDFEVSR